jgi:hypothetical protein
MALLGGNCYICSTKKVGTAISQKVEKIYISSHANPMMVVEVGQVYEVVQDY